MIELEKIKEFLELHQGDNEFYKSLYTQLHDKGFLSDRQIACVEKEMNKKKIKEFTLKPGDKITIDKWLAHKLKENVDDFSLVVEEIDAETEKAWHVKVKLDGDIIGPIWLPKSKSNKES